MSRGLHLHYNEKLLRLAVCRGGTRSNEYFPHIIGFIKQLKIFLQSVAKKQDVFGIFTDWPWQEFDLPDAKNFKCSI